MSDETEINYGKEYDALMLQTVDNKIAAHRVSTERSNVNSLEWYSSFDELPTHVQEIVSVLDMHPVNELVPRKGTRFDEGYMVLLKPDFQMVGGKKYDDA